MVVETYAQLNHQTQEDGPINHAMFQSHSYVKSTSTLLSRRGSNSPQRRRQPQQQCHAPTDGIIIPLSIDALGWALERTYSVRRNHPTLPLRRVLFSLFKSCTIFQVPPKGSVRRRRGKGVDHPLPSKKSDAHFCILAQLLPETKY